MPSADSGLQWTFPREQECDIQFIDRINGSTYVCEIDTPFANATNRIMNEDGLYREVGRRIAARRKNLSLNQSEIAARVGVSRASIANIEVGRQRVLLHQIYRLADALELNYPSDLMPTRAISNTASRPPIEDERLSKREREQIAGFFDVFGTADEGRK